MSLDARIAAEDLQCASNCGACINQCGDAPDGLSFPLAVMRRDLWTALRFASTDQAISQLDEQAARLGIAACGEDERVADFHLRIVDALIAAVRAEERAQCVVAIKKLILPPNACYCASTSPNQCDCSASQYNIALEAACHAITGADNRIVTAATTEAVPQKEGKT